MSEKVLFVDDSVQLLSAIKRRLRKDLDLVVAEDAATALELMRTEGPFAVLVTDQNMPCIDGITLMETSMKAAPQTMRILMTGQDDPGITLDAVNRAHAYAVLKKPCSPESVLRVVSDAIERFKNLNTEQDILANTLLGTVEAVTGALGISGPDARRVISMRSCASKLAGQFQGIKPWQLDLAVMLTPMIRASIPPATRQKIDAGEPLNKDENMVLERAPQAVHDRLVRIPRLEEVAEAILYCNHGYDGSGYPRNGKRGPEIPLLCRLYKIVADLGSALQTSGVPRSLSEGFSILRRNEKLYDAKLLEACRQHLTETSVADTAPHYRAVDVAPNSLADGDIIDSDVRTVYGGLVLKAGPVITSTLLQKLQHVHREQGLAGPIKVLRQVFDTSAGIATAPVEP